MRSVRWAIISKVESVIASPLTPKQAEYADAGENRRAILQWFPGGSSFEAPYRWPIAVKLKLRDHPTRAWLRVTKDYRNRYRVRSGRFKEYPYVLSYLFTPEEFEIICWLYSPRRRGAF